MSPRKILAVAFVLTFLLATSGAIRAAMITYAGADLTTNDAWRTNNVAKPLDLDANNIYGTDGFVLFGGGQGSSAPAYATVAQGAGTSVFGGNASYTNFDNAALTGAAPVANVVSGVVYNAPGGTNPTDFLTFTLTEAQTFRLGVITDNADFATISPTTLRVRQTVGGSADSGYVSAAADRDRDGDYYFFDVSGQAGDVFAVSGNNDAGHGSNGVYGVTFDSVLPANTLARLRADYDQHAPINGQSSTGKISDTRGTGEWDFFSSATQDPTALGNNLTALTYTTSANGVRNGNAYADLGQVLDLPAVKNGQLISGGGQGMPDNDELALHPGEHSQGRQFFVTRWTAGAGEDGLVNIAGNVRDLGTIIDGISFALFVDGTPQIGPTTVATNLGLDFDFDVSVSVGSTVDFVVGNNGSYFGDHAALSVTITQIVPESSTLALLAPGLFGLAIWWRRRRS